VRAIRSYQEECGIRKPRFRAISFADGLLVLLNAISRSV
jgi:hypothetical protein